MKLKSNGTRPLADVDVEHVPKYMPDSDTSAETHRCARRAAVSRRQKSWAARSGARAFDKDLAALEQQTITRNCSKN